MLVKIKFLKDHSGYKKGQECAMLLSYAERFQREGVVRIIDGNVDKWIVKPEPEIEQNEDEQEVKEMNFLDRLINNKK